MQSEASSLFFPPIESSSLGYNVLLILFIVFIFLIRPGGLAWVGCSSSIPGPVGVPFLGMVFAFAGGLTHRVLAKAARTTGGVRLMSFSIWLTRFVISTHPDTAKEILTSSAFADRPVKESAYELLFHRAMGFAPYGDYWRNLRRISATYLFSPRRISGFGSTRRVIGLEMSHHIERSMKATGRVEVRKLLHYASLNNVMSSVFGKRYDFHDARDTHAEELDSLVSRGYELLGVFNWSDHFVFLKWLDLQGVRRRCRKLAEQVNSFVGRIIQERRDMSSIGYESYDSYHTDQTAGDFLDVLLGLQNEGTNKLSDSDMIAVLWEMIFRGTDTVAILLEWVLARMVLHPEVQEKAYSEIMGRVGSRPVEDSDLTHLPYVQAIVKETLRLHPPGPLLSWARLAIHETRVGDSVIPAGTTAMVNMWAITHDPGFWPDPERFSPDRFVHDDLSVLGSDLRLAPFGSGRRVCPGKALGLATVHLWLAQLLQRFSWIECDGGVDLSECLKLSLEMKHRLRCMAVVRT